MAGQAHPPKVKQGLPTRGIRNPAHDPASTEAKIHIIDE
jgi:hypothetical protein